VISLTAQKVCSLPLLPPHSHPENTELAWAIPFIVAAALPRDSLLNFEEWLDLFALRLVRGIHSIDFGA
jgi:hypothetical protein